MPAAATAAPGNNGTVKVAPHGDVDAIPNNTPHVGCTFQLEWYGFDAGVTSTVSFTEQAPTTGVGMSVSGPGTVTLDNDPGNGAGNDGFDGSAVYTLSFTGAPHPQQGYHVDLTINTPESNGADVKHKVFWVEGCDAPTPPPATPTTPAPTTPAPTTPAPTTPAPTTPAPTTPAPTTPAPTTPAPTTPAPTTPPVTPSVEVSPATASTTTPDAGDDNGAPEVLGVQASTGPKNGPKNGPKTTVKGQQAQAQPAQSGGVTVAGRQQAVPTTVNAGAEAASPVEQGVLVPAVLASLAALLGLGAVAARRRRA